ncbi:MAG TPA: alcohol dehydrogenase catalytic domain-containing protein [Vicinamibacterales bacterium]|nr:alcohol dehydrogenase catalytic domain-containing protein [Vicinamibacterales bacterium]
MKVDMELESPQTRSKATLPMKALVYRGPGDRAWVERPRPAIQEATDAVVRITTSTICGTDLHIMKGDVPSVTPGRTLGHEGIGIVQEVGTAVTSVRTGDRVLISCITACGKCEYCKRSMYSHCRVGGWILGNTIDGTQAEYVRIPHADTSLYHVPAGGDEEALVMLSDILPTGFHGAVTAGVGVGSVVYVAGAGPVGLAAAASASILGAAVVLVGDMNQERLAHAKAVGFEPVDLTKSDKLEDLIEQIVGVPEVDASVDAVGFEARGHGTRHTEEAPAAVLNSLMTVTRPGGAIGIPGLYVTEDPGSKDAAAQQGNLRMRFGLGWAKSHRFATGQTPVLRYNLQLMQAILHDRLPIAKIVNASVITLDEAPGGYRDFDKGVARKFVLDPHGAVARAA